LAQLPIGLAIGLAIVLSVDFVTAAVAEPTLCVHSKGYNVLITQCSDGSVYTKPDGTRTYIRGQHRQSAPLPSGR
jgi:hypothetical protein